MRIEAVYKPGVTDGRATRIANELSLDLGIPVEVAYYDVYFVLRDGFTAKHAESIFLDPVVQNIRIDAVPSTSKCDVWVEVAYRPGVTDTVALTAHEAITVMLDDTTETSVSTARGYAVTFADAIDDSEDLTPISDRIVAYLHNPLIESAVAITRNAWNAGRRPPSSAATVVPTEIPDVVTYDLAQADDLELERLSRTRLLALTLPEMRAIRDHIAGAAEKRRSVGVPTGITDVELELIAQTWSEHCKHKIFQARFEYTVDGETRVVDGLFRTYIRQTTEQLASTRDDLLSVFHDNSGVVAFDDETVVCMKVETHNSPSALDPYGGAITGIVGVNRDILGTGIGARPILNTNVLCFGYPDTKDVPEGLLPPRRVMAGVHRGIVDGGNQSGIPVVGGAFLFDDSFVGKPLVFCGTGGVLPRIVNGKPSWETTIEPGDVAVMLGGRIGKDGIHGATFSSLGLDEDSPTSAVQIGDPIIQRKMTDLLLEARDRGLYRALTDNGAGGLSSSLGEMAERAGGIRIELDGCPLKYPGLAAWEILVSESQERMSLAVPPERLGEFLALAAKRRVEASRVGEFTDSGVIDVFHRGSCVAHLPLEFVHGGVPTLEIPAVWVPPHERLSAPLSADAAVVIVGSGAHGSESVPEAAPAAEQYRETVLAILSEPNVASKEDLIRQYDHEVQAGSVVKPFCGPAADGPTDGAVYRPKYDSRKGITITHGICPRYSRYDTYRMAACAVDEAYRAHIALGGDPDAAYALDNFCWPDPVLSAETPDGEYKAAQLIRACEALYDYCTSYRLPLISGKDSMKNDARMGGKKVSVLPTLLITLIGTIPDIARAVTSDFKRPGDVVYLAGLTRAELGGSVLEQLIARTRERVNLGEAPLPRVDETRPVYRALFDAVKSGLIASMHDVSDGGLAACVAESALAGRVGAEIQLDDVPRAVAPDRAANCSELLFSESAGRILVTASPADATEFQKSVAGLPVQRIGRVTDESKIRFLAGGVSICSVALEAVENAWNALRNGGIEG
ncbi:MAG: phosphoribosylformylglycinamidine synthase [Spirochaetaceae bacterium]|nr:MAG: phosphoribosylformylglycinamidine synthase [Spirochaetaceae bacterium]